jgi:hypothetical protein
MSYGLEIYSANGDVMLANDKSLLRVILVIDYPDIDYGETWTYTNDLITEGCIGLLWNATFYITCYNGSLTLTGLPHHSGLTNPAAPAGSFRLIKG